MNCAVGEIPRRGEFPGPILVDGVSGIFQLFSLLEFIPNPLTLGICTRNGPREFSYQPQCQISPGIDSTLHAPVE